MSQSMILVIVILVCLAIGGIGLVGVTMGWLGAMGYLISFGALAVVLYLAPFLVPAFINEHAEL